MYYKDFLQYSNNLSVLFIEDDEKIRNEFTDILKLFFNKVDSAKNGIEGLHLYREFYINSDNYYDIVITEVEMELMGGEQLIKEIKLLNKDQVFVVVSDSNQVDSLISFIKLGIKDFLQKPLSAGEFQESLYQLSKDIISKKNPHINYSKVILEEINEPDNSIDFLRYDDSICLSKVI